MADARHDIAAPEAGRRPGLLPETGGPCPCRHRARLWWREYRRLAVGLAWAAVYGLAWWGVRTQFRIEGTPRGEREALYRALQLFVLEDGGLAVSRPACWQLEAARFLAPTLTTYTALIALVGLFRERIQRLRLHRARGHVVVCGLGRKGLSFARDFSRRGHRVVAIENDGDNDSIPGCIELGITVLIGDATDPAMLRAVRADRAACVLAVTDSDATNLEVAVAMHAMTCRQCPEPDARVRCYVHVVGLKLCGLLARHPMFTEETGQCSFALINIYQNSARLMLRDCPLDRTGLGPADPRTVHLAVLGFGQMGESVAVQAARLSHFANGRKLRLTVVDCQAHRRERVFLARYPGLASVCDTRFVEADVDDPEFVAEACTWGDDPSTLTTIVIAFDSDARGLSCTLDLLSRCADAKTPIIVRMSDDTGIAALLEGTEANPAWRGRVRLFGVAERTCTCQALLEEELDRMARTIHDDYVAQRRREGRPPEDASLQAWEHIAASLRDSNRQQADHIDVKLRAIGCQAAAPRVGEPAVETLTPGEVEVLAAMEHARWNAERFLDGWTLGPKDVARRVSPYLVPWDQLPDTIREYDREAVRNIPRLVALSGRRVYRLPGRGGALA